MKEVVRLEVLHDLSETSKILKVKETKDLEELANLSDHSIKNIALYKDLELVSVTVLIYSIYKIISRLSKDDHVFLVQTLDRAIEGLETKNFGKYNLAMKIMYKHVRQCNAKVRLHLQDVMDAARIKKGSSLLQEGLSIGQAAGLMGISNWDLQAYAGKIMLGEHTETFPAKKRLERAMRLFL
ncbi:MAG TPA: hypothetical protein VJI98_05145 [Candidatus Nanoarchaeia archaeon]|nr:hypothetical protein [Candidatus Nanoarchaeia archaeon]